MAGVEWSRVLPRETIRRIYEKAGLGASLARQQEVAHLSGERVEDLTITRNRAVRAAVLDANEKTGVPIKQLMTEKPGY